MLEKNNKISVLTKMIGIGDEKTPQLIVPQNSLTNFHARMGLSEKSVNMAGSGAQAPTIACPHCQNMAKNFLYLESLIRANGSPKNKCSLCSSTLRYVEYVNKSILDVFAKNASIIEAAQKYSTAKPRFRMPKLMSRVSRLTGGGRKTAVHSAVTTNPPYGTMTTTTSSVKRHSPKRKSIKPNESAMAGKSGVGRNISKAAKANNEKSSTKKDAKTKTITKSVKQGSKASLKTTGKTTTLTAAATAATTATSGTTAAVITTTATTGRSKALSVESLTKSKKTKTGKKKTSSTILKKESLRAKRRAGTTEQQAALVA